MLNARVHPWSCGEPRCGTAPSSLLLFNRPSPHRRRLALHPAPGPWRLGQAATSITNR